MRTLPPSHIAPGDTGRLWRHYDDRCRVVLLAAQPADDRVLARSAGIHRVVGAPSMADGAPAWSFFPLALAGELPDVEVVEAVKTGGRTFHLTASARAALGLPAELHLDLPRLGRGTVRVGVDIEVKGAGSDAGHVRARRGLGQPVLRQRRGLPHRGRPALDDLLAIWRTQLRADRGATGRALAALATATDPHPVASGYARSLGGRATGRLLGAVQRFNTLDPNILPVAHAPRPHPTFNKYGISQGSLMGRTPRYPGAFGELTGAGAELLVTVLAQLTTGDAS